MSSSEIIIFFLVTVKNNKEGILPPTVQRSVN